MQAVDLSLVRKVLITGTNFGSAAVMSLTGVVYVIDSQPYTSSSILPNASDWATGMLATNAFEFRL